VFVQHGADTNVFIAVGQVALYRGYGRVFGQKLFIFPHFFLGILARLLFHGAWLAFLQVFGLAFGIEPPYRIQNVEVVEADKGQEEYGYHFFQWPNITNPSQMQTVAFQRGVFQIFANIITELTELPNLRFGGAS
jgi:hypothetical protein